MHRAHRCTLAGTARAPTCANRVPARCYPLPGRPPCRAAACSTKPTIPRAPRPRIRPAARAQPCAHRPHRAHRAPPPASPSRVASAPGPWLARIAPHASLFRRMRERGPPPGSIRPKCMLFEIKMATSSPYASISGRNRAIQDTWRANLAAKGPLSRRGARNHARREDVASAARPFRGSGLRPAERALRPAARAWPACRMRPPLPSRLCLPPTFIAAVLYASRFTARIAPTHAPPLAAPHPAARVPLRFR